MALQSLATHWLTHDANAAMAWLVANGDRVPAQAFGAAAMQLAQEDPDAAALYIDQVPSGLRKDWILHTVQGIAQGDPQRVAGFIMQFRGEPGYEEMVVTAAQTSAWQDPTSAVRLLDGVDPSSAGYRNVVGSIVSSWAQQDWPAARAWTLGLPRGDTRDIALLGFVQVFDGGALVPDRRLLSAFSSEETQQEAVRQVVYQLAARNPNEARSFADEWISNPVGRSEAEQAIDMIAQQSR
jgi:hypothetical protein